MSICIDNLTLYCVCFGDKLPLESQYNQKNIDDYNTYIINYIADKKNNYYNILNKILYYNDNVIKYLPTDREIEYVNQRLRPYFDIQNLIPSSLLYEQSELDIILNSMVSNISAKYSWVNELGHYICEYINLEVNKDVIDSYNSQLFTIGRKLYGEATKLKGYDYLIGNRKELYTYNNKDKSNIKITIPLRFWFCKDVQNSLPMTNILYSDVEIAFKVRNFLDLLQIAPYSYVDKTPRFRCNVLVTYIYLEMQERLRIAASKLEFLIETNQTSKVQVFTSKDIVSSKIKSKLYFSGPSKIIIWRARIMKNGKKVRLVKINNEIQVVDDNKTNWNKNGCQLYTPYIKQVFVPSTKQYINLIYTDVEEIQIIKSTDILFNGNVRQAGTTEYYNYVTPYDSNLGSLDSSVFMYSFALFPKLTQPSGAANLSMIEDLTIEHVLTSNIIDYITSNNLELELEYFTQTYQIMRVMSGFIAPAFVYPK